RPGRSPIRWASGWRSGQPQVGQLILLETDMVPQFVHHGHLNLPRDPGRRAEGAFEWPAKDGDLIRQYQGVGLSSLVQRHSLVQPEHRARRSIPGRALANLLRRRLVLDDDFDVVQHGRNRGREAIKRSGHEPFKSTATVPGNTGSDRLAHAILYHFSAHSDHNSWCTYADSLPDATSRAQSLNLGRQRRPTGAAQATDARQIGHPG